MRQAGRYMAEYRAVRARLGFLELCKQPEAAADVTVTATEILGVDAAIIFADILLILEPLGVGLEYTAGEGPVLHRPLRDPAAIAALPAASAAAELGFVSEAIRQARAALQVPLIGFAGAPFTLASYLIEGGASRNYIHTKRLMYRAPEAWNTLLDRLARETSVYLNAQIAAGADVVQLFDSWVGCLTPNDYRRYVQPHVRTLVQGITPGVPVIHFGTGTGGFLEDLRDAGGDVIGVDWRLDLGDARRRLGPSVAIQGNLDPVILFADTATIRAEVERILAAVGGAPGHIFNLGHGILPETPVDNVLALVEMVHELSAR
jgi:uroporphyrinogen decarboxylase